MTHTVLSGMADALRAAEADRDACRAENARLRVAINAALHSYWITGNVTILTERLAALSPAGDAP